MDIDLSALVVAKDEEQPQQQQQQQQPHASPPRSRCDEEEEEDAMQEMLRRKERLSRRGQLLRSVLGRGGAKYVIDLGEYRRKKVRVFVQYEGYTVNALERKDRLRVGISVPAKWIDSQASKLKQIFIDAYNKRCGRIQLSSKNALLSLVDTRSYLNFAKTMVPDDAIVGDVFHENEEIFLVTEEDVLKIDEAVKSIETSLIEYEKLAIEHRTVDPEDVLAMTTVSKQIDPRNAHVLLVGMNKLYMLPVQLHYTIADIKAFIHFKGGPDNFPLGSLDVALIENYEINILSDDDTILTVARKIFDADLNFFADDDSHQHKPTVPLYWGKRLQDPKYFIWIPSLHTPDSFKGPNDEQSSTTAAAPNGQSPPPQTTGGDCSIC